ncbi:MAG: diphthine--ammonia ligase [Nitrososphaerota archaeon]|nr:diphthine--ammonia ligase [Nitrososphaerota archaeon]
MKAVALMSGGKDSFLSTVIALEQGMDIVEAITVIPEEFSYMYHFPNADKASFVSGLLNLRSEYVNENNLASKLKNFAESGVGTLISGAIASDYQKTRIENLCTNLNMRSFTPLWRKDQEDVLMEIIRRGISPIIVSVSADGFTKEDLGRVIDENYLVELKKKEEKFGINISGEGGEYETFVTYPGYGTGLNLTKSHILWEGSHGYLLLDEVS